MLINQRCFYEETWKKNKRTFFYVSYIQNKVSYVVKTDIIANILARWIGRAVLMYVETFKMTLLFLSITS